MRGSYCEPPPGGAVHEANQVWIKSGRGTTKKCMLVVWMRHKGEDAGQWIYLITCYRTKVIDMHGLCT